jgi:general secretion pathway protein I
MIGCLRCRGFLLVEVMVALTIIAVSLSFIMVAITQNIDTVSTLRDRSYAVWIAQNKIAEMRLANVIPDVSATSGEVEYANGLWDWRAVISETGIENLLRLDVSVSHAGSEDVVRSVTGFIGEPIAPGQSNQVWNSGQWNFGQSPEGARQ